MALLLTASPVTRLWRLHRGRVRAASPAFIWCPEFAHWRRLAQPLVGVEWNPSRRLPSLAQPRRRRGWSRAWTWRRERGVREELSWAPRSGPKQTVPALRVPFPTGENQPRPLLVPFPGGEKRLQLARPRSLRAKQLAPARLTRLGGDLSLECLQRESRGQKPPCHLQTGPVKTSRSLPFLVAPLLPRPSG